MSPAASSRWCPTPEQLMILEEMYRSGIRTPKATQIQQITAHLSLYGRIEGKNVFYWFQNHKARDRQKLRKKLSKQIMIQQQQLQAQQQEQPQKQLYHQFHPAYSPDRYYIHHHFHYGSSSPSSSYPQVTYHNEPSSRSSVFPSQGGGGGASRVVNWKNMEVPAEGLEKPITEAYECDWRMMTMMMMTTTTMNHADTPSPCPDNMISSPALKTLQLFPITASDVKQDPNSKP